MIVLHKTHISALAAQQQGLAEAVIAFALSATLIRQAHEREVAILRGENIALRNEISVLKGRIVAAGHAR